MGYLVPAAANWAGTVGLAFTPEGFEEYLKSLGAAPSWPQFIALHNTDAPTLKSWHDKPQNVPAGSTRTRQRLLNLTHDYRDLQHWHAGPHLFVDDEFIWVFTPLDKPGIHSPSWNKLAWAIEMVGDYDHEPLSEGVRQNTVAALASLSEWRGLDPGTMRLHKEDPRTTHANCPGKNVVKADMIEATRRAMLVEGEHSPKAEEAPTDVPAAPPATHVVKAGDTLWGISRRYGVPAATLTGLNGSGTLSVGQVVKLSGDAPPAPHPASPEPLKPSLDLAKFIGSKEAFVSVRYMDKGTPAIGFGHNDKTLASDAKITIEEGLAILEKDLADAGKAVSAAAKVPIVQYEFDALCDMAFNAGGNALAGSSLIAKLNAGDRQGAADGLLKWNKTRNEAGELVVSPGLTARCEARRKMFLAGDYGDISTYPHYDGDPKKTKPVRKPFPA